MMRRFLVPAAVLALMAAAGFDLWAAPDRTSGDCAIGSRSAKGGQCCATPEAAAPALASGKVLGNFDPTMSGCRFACAMKSAYDPKNLVPQPGPGLKQITQCPVSGVVFAVDARRPRVRVGSDEYVTCCAACAGKLRGNPARFVKV